MKHKDPRLLLLPPDYPVRQVQTLSLSLSFLAFSSSFSAPAQHDPVSAKQSEAEGLHQLQTQE